MSVAASRAGTITMTLSSLPSTELEATLVRFMNLFRTHIPVLHSSPLQSIAQLADLSIILDFLQAMEPIYFDMTLSTEGDLPSTTTPSSIPMQDVQQLYSCLQSFFQDTQKKSIHDSYLNLPKLSAAFPSELTTLLKLSILCSINSTNQEDVVNSIMQMKDSDQTVMMLIINDTMTRYSIENSSASATGGGAVSPRVAPALSRAGSINTSQHKTLKLDNESTTPVSTNGAPSSMPPSPLSQKGVRTRHNTHLYGLPSERSMLRELESPLSPLLSTRSNPGALPASNTGARLPHPINNHSQTIAQLQAQFDAERQQFNEQINTLTTTNKQLQHQLHDTQAIAEKLQSSQDKAVQTAVARALELTESKHSFERRQMEQKHAKNNDELQASISDVQLQLKKQQSEYQVLLREKQRVGDELLAAKTDAQQLRDELQITKHRAENVTTLEAKVQRLQSRLDSTGDLHAQQAFIEQQNQQHITSIVNLEQQVRELTVVKNNVNKYKDQVLGLQQDVTDLKVNDDAQKHTIEELQQQTTTYQERIKQLQDALRQAQQQTMAANEQLNELQKQYSQSLQSSQQHHDLRSQITKLELENAQLRSTAELAAHSAELRDEADRYKRLAAENEDKYINAQRRVTTLESTVRMQEFAATHGLNNSQQQIEEKQQPSSHEIEQLRHECIEYQERLIAASKLRLELESQLGQLQLQLQQADPQADERYREVATKLDAMTIRNKKLEAFVKNAHDKVRLSFAQIEQMKAVERQTLSSMEMLKQQLAERDQHLREVDSIRVDEQRASERERKLMATAFYSIGLDYSAALANGRAFRKQTPNDQFLTPSASPAEALTGRLSDATNLSQASGKPTAAQQRSWLDSQRRKFQDKD